MTSETGLVRGKRERELSLKIRNPRSRKIIHEEEKVAGCLVNLIENPNYHHTQQKKHVYMAPDVFKTIFNEDSRKSYIVNIANYLYRAILGNYLPRRHIELDSISCRDTCFSSSLISAPEIFITPAKFLPENIGSIVRLHVCIEPWGTPTLIGHQKMQTILTSDLELLIKRNYKDTYFALSQSFLLLHSKQGPLKATIDKWWLDEVNPLQIDSEVRVPRYAKLSEHITLSFISGDTSHLQIVEVNIDPITHFKFTIGSVTELVPNVFQKSSVKILKSNAWKRGLSPLPLRMPKGELIEKIRVACKGVLLPLGELITFTSGSWCFKVLLKNVLVDRDQARFDLLKETENPRVFRITDETIKINSSAEVHLTTPIDLAQTARHLTFKIVGIKNRKLPKKNEVRWIGHDQITEAIRKLKPLLMTIDSRVVITVKEVQYLLELTEAKQVSSEISEESTSGKVVWLVDEKTECTAFSFDLPTLRIVKTSAPVPLKSLTIKASTSKTSLLLPRISARMSIALSFEQQENEFISELELQEAFEEALGSQHIVYEKQLIEGTTKQGKTVYFTLDSLTSLARTDQQQSCVYQYLPATTLTFIGDKNLLVIPKPTTITPDNIDQKLIEYGIGGMSKKVKEAIISAVLAKTSFPEHMKTIEQKPSRGLLLWGPPGMGKTLLAKQLGKLLCINEVEMISCSQIWQKYLGESEKLVRELFSKARAAQKAFGDKSPRRILILDEADAILGIRTEEGQRYETSVLCAFLAEMDGASEGGLEPLDNILVIALTNRPEALDPAVKRPGRLYPLIHIGLPDNQGRLEIFDIHTKALRESGFLAADVDRNAIAKLTTGKSGAFIESMVSIASQKSLLRIWEQKVEKEQITIHPAAKVNQNDFVSAYYDSVDGKTKQDLSTLIPAVPTDIAALKNELQKFGLVGLSQETLKFVFDLKISQHLKKTLISFGQSFPRGVLIHGVPGTGKTKLAKSLRKLLGLDKSFFTYFNASELLNLSPQKIKKQMEEIAETAKHNYKDLKEEARLQIVVIDEMDTLFLQENPASPGVNGFIGALEPLFEHEKLHNLLVIGISRRDEKQYFERVTRFGRFGKHLEMILPEPQGRHEIFEMYLRPQLDQKLLDNTVTLKQLAQLTHGFSGAYIRGIVNAAVQNYLRRITVSGEKDAKMTWNDFKTAHDELSKNPRNGMYM